ncbi:hypothetical protein FSP39_010111 [Pinctada imbricata]|uniref:DZIP3-like HEPN domain-containing protein n=1 Tax=Pinctada imbricata TaxID=66713 RepID=A0AA88XYX0_PINIB|nr:hypothetical protein FSP39_010111 [Pinctada imbricata]
MSDGVLLEISSLPYAFAMGMLPTFDPSNFVYHITIKDRQLQDDERDNFCRVGQAIVGICSNIYRDALTKYISPTRILVIAQSDWSFWTGLFPGQKNHVRHASKDGYKYFDISLCYKLLRNLCAPRSIGFTVLNGRWGQQPNHSETGFVDDLERIRELRNVTYAHLPNTIIQNNEYTTIWHTLEGICIRMKNHLNKDYPAELQKLRFYKMADWKELIELIERNKERDEQTREFARKIEAIEKELEENREAHVTIKSNFETNKRKLESQEGEIRTHGEKILKLEKEKSEINPLKVSDLKIKLLKLSKDQKIKVSPLQKMGQYPLELMYSDVRIMENVHYESQRMNDDQRQGKEMKSIRDILYENGCHQTVQHVLASDEYRCLIILDGLDEWRPNKHAKEELVHQHIPNIEDVSNCTFLISSRPWKFDFILDTLRSDDQVDLGKVAYNDLNKNVIKDGEMSARKEIARFERNCEGIFSSDSDETASIKSLSTDDADDLQFEVFNCLNYNFVFQRDALESEIGETSLNFALDVGILSLCEAPGSLNEENVNVEFIDKCVQELLAAVYIAAKNQDMKDFFVDIATTLEMANVVNFICGLSPSLGSKLSKHIVELTHKDFRISEYRKCIHTYQFHNFIGNIHDCLLVAHKELRQNESSRDKFEIFYFSDFLINPDMTIENVYRSEAVLSDKHLRLCSLFVSCINKFIPGSIVQCFRFRDPYVFMHKSRFLTTVNISGPCICEDYFDISSVISGNLWIDMRSTRHYSSEKDSASDMAIMLLLSYMPVLHTVSFWRVDLYNSPVVPFLTHNAKLSVLELCHVTFHNYEPESKTEECIAPCLSHLPQLSELWVNELTVYKPVSTPFLSYLPILETLSLNKVSIHLKEVLVSVAAPVLSFMPLLESLILKDVVINDSDVEYKTDTGFLISQMPNLQSLKLTNVDLGRRHLELSSDMTRMETVICTKVNMSSRAWENFVESVIDIHKEYEIELNTCELNDKLKTKLSFQVSFKC